jgi:hypothetical protein
MEKKWTNGGGYFYSWGLPQCQTPTTRSVMSTSTTYSDSPTPQPQSYQSYSDASHQPSTSQATTTVAASSSSTATVAPPPQTRQAAEEARKDRTLAEFLLMLDEYEPLVCPMFIPPYASRLTCAPDPQRGHGLLSPESWVRMRRCPHVSRFLLCPLYVHSCPLFVKETPSVPCCSEICLRRCI